MANEFYKPDENGVTIVSAYNPSEKQSIFHRSSAKFKILKGGLGSGKTRMAVEEINNLLAEYPGIVIYVMRKTMPALRDSTLHEFLKYIDPNLGTYNKKTEQFNAVNYAEIRFRGLDEASKMKGPEPAVLVLDEGEEFTYEDFITLKGRARQTTDHLGRPTKYPLHVIILFNPVDEDHWLYKQFVQNAGEYEKSGGLLLMELSTYDNIQNLPQGYIESTTAGMTPEQIERYIYGKWGSIIRGKPVFEGTFNADLHLRQVEYKPGVHILKRGWDFGFNHPACSFTIQDPLGRKNIHFEMMGTKEYLDIFAQRVLMQTKLRYGDDIKVFDYCDPRGFDRSPNSTSDQENSVQILNEFGIFPKGERGIREYVEPGIQVLRKELSTLIEGVPELTISPECTIHRAAIGGKYVRGDDGKPVKDGYFEHMIDATRYRAYMDRTNNAVKSAILDRARKVQTRLVNRVTGYGRVR